MPTQRQRGPIALAAVAVVAGVVHAARLRWTTDDAYISFRYAEHLVQGQGLIYNVGERVEGYSNFLWTLWCALGLRLGVAPETWTEVSGIVCYALCLGLLARFSLQRGTRAGALAGQEASGAARLAPLAVPVAALAGAAHHDWAVFATSGLETSFFTLLVLSGCLLLIGRLGPRRAAAAGVVLALAALTRPDGLLFALLGGAVVLLAGRNRVRTTLAYGAAAAALLLPYAGWKLSYYGSLLPNTFYAKSGMETWYTQGAVYALLYFEKYWVLLAGAPLVIWGWLRLRRVRGGDPDDGWARAVLVTGAFALAYTWAVVRVGGDFMFARFLIPVTPLYLLLLELGLERTPLRPTSRIAASAAAILAVALAPSPLPDQGFVRGIADEWQAYATESARETRRQGEVLKRLFAGLHLRVGFIGGQAVLAYRSKVPVAIETSTGLTDATIAHQPLLQRRRVGHEKGASIQYVLEQRQAQLWLYQGKSLTDVLSPYIPIVPIRLGSLDATVLRWEPELMETLRARGAEVADFPQTLDRYIQERLPHASDAEVAEFYGKLRRFYFGPAGDHAREAPFLARLGRRGSGRRRGISAGTR